MTALWDAVRIKLEPRTPTTTRPSKAKAVVPKARRFSLGRVEGTAGGTAVEVLEEPGMGGGVVFIGELTIRVGGCTTSAGWWFATGDSDFMAAGWGISMDSGN
jgi:hypothetical protein